MVGNAHPTNTVKAALAAIAIISLDKLEYFIAAKAASTKKLPQLAFANFFATRRHFH